MCMWSIAQPAEQRPSVSHTKSPGTWRVMLRYPLYLWMIILVLSQTAKMVVSVSEEVVSWRELPGREPFPSVKNGGREGSLATAT